MEGGRDDICIGQVCVTVLPVIITAIAADEVEKSEQQPDFRM